MDDHLIHLACVLVHRKHTNLTKRRNVVARSMKAKGHQQRTVFLFVVKLRVERLILVAPVGGAQLVSEFHGSDAVVVLPRVPWLRRHFRRRRVVAAG